MKMMMITGLLFLTSAGTLRAADPTTKGVETDRRLHSDGQGWRLDQAEVVDR